MKHRLRTILVRSFIFIALATSCFSLSRCGTEAGKSNEKVAQFANTCSVRLRPHAPSEKELVEKYRTTIWKVVTAGGRCTMCHQNTQNIVSRLKGAPFAALDVASARLAALPSIVATNSDLEIRGGNLSHCTTCNIAAEIKSAVTEYAKFASIESTKCAVAHEVPQPANPIQIKLKVDEIKALYHSLYDNKCSSCHKLTGYESVGANSDLTQFVDPIVWNPNRPEHTGIISQADLEKVILFVSMY